MSEQLSFVQKIRRKPRKVTAPEKIAAKLNTLADFYAVHKPGLKSITISQEDAYSLRTMKERDEKENTNECGMAGFHFLGVNIEWRGFDLVVQPNG